MLLISLAAASVVVLPRATKLAQLFYAGPQGVEETLHALDLRREPDATLALTALDRLEQSGEAKVVFLEQLDSRWLVRASHITRAADSAIRIAALASPPDPNEPHSGPFQFDLARADYKSLISVLKARKSGDLGGPSSRFALVSALAARAPADMLWTMFEASRPEEPKALEAWVEFVSEGLANRRDQRSAALACTLEFFDKNDIPWPEFGKSLRDPATVLEIRREALPLLLRNTYPEHAELDACLGRYPGTGRVERAASLFKQRGLDQLKAIVYRHLTESQRESLLERLPRGFCQELTLSPDDSMAGGPISREEMDAWAKQQGPVRFDLFDEPRCHALGERTPDVELGEVAEQVLEKLRSPSKRRAREQFRNGLLARPGVDWIDTLIEIESRQNVSRLSVFNAICESMTEQHWLRLLNCHADSEEAFLVVTRAVCSLHWDRRPELFSSLCTRHGHGKRVVENYLLAVSRNDAYRKSVIDWQILDLLSLRRSKLDEIRSNL